MGLLDDLAMGFGLKERTEDYDARTARNIAVSRVAADRGDEMDATFRAQAYNPDHWSYYANYEPGMAAHDKYLFDIGGSTYTPQIVEPPEDNNFFQNLLYSAPMSEDNPVSPRRLAIGPVNLDEPLSIPTPLSMMTKILGGLQRPSGRDDPLTSTAFDKYNEDDTAESLAGIPKSNFLSDWDLASMAAKANKRIRSDGVY